MVSKQQRAVSVQVSKNGMSWMLQAESWEQTAVS